MTVVGALGLTALSAAAYAAAFPPTALAPLGWVALSPLWYVAAQTTPRRAAAYGAVWGIAAAYGVGTWFPGMVTDYFGWPWWAGWLGFFATAVASASLYYGAFAAWVAWLAARGRLSPLALAVGWVACEFARVRLLLGNPWGLLAHSQSQYLTLIQAADVGGVYAVSLVVACGNAAMTALLLPAARGRSVPGAVAVLAIPLVALGYGSWRLGQRFTADPTLPVGVVQSGFAREFVWRPGAEAFGLSRHLELTREVAGRGARLVLWPESAIGFYLQELRPEREELLAALRELDVDLALGGPHYAFEGGETRYHNSVFFIRDANVVSRYDKRELLPFAEKSPFGAEWQRQTPLSPGAGVRAVELAGVRLGPVVCSESMQSKPAASVVAAGAEVIANLSNDSWMAAESAALQQRDVAVFRAVETRRYLVRAASTGVSAIVDPHGAVVASAPFGRPATLLGSVAPGRYVSFHQRWGDLLAWSAVVLAFWISRPGRRRARAEDGPRP